MCKAWRAGGTSTVNNRFIRVGFVKKSEQWSIRCFRGSWGKTRDALKKFNCIDDDSCATNNTAMAIFVRRSWKRMATSLRNTEEHDKEKEFRLSTTFICFNQFYGIITALCKCFHWLKQFLKWAMYPMDLCKIKVLINNHFCYFCVILFLYYVKGNFKKYSLEYG